MKLVLILIDAAVVLIGPWCLPVLLPARGFLDMTRRAAVNIEIQQATQVALEDTLEACLWNYRVDAHTAVDLCPSPATHRILTREARYVLAHAAVVGALTAWLEPVTLAIPALVAPCALLAHRSMKVKAAAAAASQTDLLVCRRESVTTILEARDQILLDGAWSYFRERMQSLSAEWVNLEYQYQFASNSVLVLKDLGVSALAVCAYWSTNAFIVIYSGSRIVACASEWYNGQAAIQRHAMRSEKLEVMFHDALDSAPFGVTRCADSACGVEI